MLNRFLEPTPKFTYRGKRYCVRFAGRSLVLLLQEIETAIGQGKSLLPLRGHIAEVRRSLPPVLATYLVRNSSHAIRLRILIWLLGKNHEHYATKEIVGRHDHQDRKVRLAVVRSLVKLSAWSQLRIIEQQGQYLDSQRAAEKRRPDFSTRLAAFTNTVSRIEFEEREREELVVEPNATIGGGRLPRSEKAIRAVIRRIRWILYRSKRRRTSFCNLRCRSS
ncbi:MAG: hypothetical protein WBD20_27530 [Pirellulaceae bacterium]